MAAKISERWQRQWQNEPQTRKNTISWDDDVGENSPGGFFIAEGLMKPFSGNISAEDAG